MENSRDELQTEAFHSLFRNNRLILRWGTSTGKSRVAILAAYYLVKNSIYPPKILIMVAEIAHKENWRKEFYKFLGEKDAEETLKCITFECYASLTKHRNTKWTLIVFDEAHHLKSDLRQEVIETMNSEYVLALSATLPEDVFDILTWTFGAFEQSNVSLQDSIDSGYVSEPKIICIPLELERFERTETIEFDYRTKKSGDKGIIKDFWSNRWKYIKKKSSYTGYLIQFSCTQKEVYEYIDKQFEYYKKQYKINPENERLKNIFLQWGSKRKRFIGELKTQKVAELCNKLRINKKRFICFCSSIDQADKLGGVRAIHSEKKNSFNVIDKFNRKEINEIYPVGMLQEGVSLNDIQVGIIVQLDGVERGFIQKFGRTLRAEKPVQYILYYKDTKDEIYLKNALEGINEDYITYEDNNY